MLNQKLVAGSVLLYLRVAGRELKKSLTLIYNKKKPSEHHEIERRGTIKEYLMFNWKENFAATPVSKIESASCKHSIPLNKLVTFHSTRPVIPSE